MHCMSSYSLYMYYLEVESECRIQNICNQRTKVE